MSKPSGNPFPFDPVRELPPGRTFDVFRYIATWQELRHACELLREKLDLESDACIPVTYYSRLILRALWAAMRQLGEGDVPSWPESLNKDSYSALFRAADVSLEPERFYFEGRRRVLSAIDDVERWCGEKESKMASVESEEAAEAFHMLTNQQRSLMRLLLSQPSKQATVRYAMKAHGKSHASKREWRSFLQAIRRLEERLAAHYPHLEIVLNQTAKTITVADRATKATKQATKL